MVDSNPLPRVLDRKLNLRQELFAHHFFYTNNATESYRLAGYEVTSDEDAQKGGQRLRKDIRVRALLDQLRLEKIDEIENNAKKTILRLELVYYEAYDEGDWMAAISALRELGKVFGIFERDNTQKRVTQEDADRMRTELEKLGLNLTRVNAPAHLKNGDGSGTHN